MSQAGKKAREFDRKAGERSSGLFGEFWSFLKHNKKWWLLPILIVLLALGALVLVSGTGVAPFIYALF